MELKKINGIDSAVLEVVTGIEEKLFQIKEELAPYKNGVVTAETLEAWLKDRAKLNKERTSYERERKDLTASWKDKLNPIIDAYGKIKVEYDVAIESIDTQTKEFEERRIAEKKAHIKELFDSIPAPDGLEEWITLEEIYDKKWENKNAKEKDIMAAITTAWEKLRADVTTIKLLSSEYESEALEVLKQTKDLQKAFQRIAELNEQEKRIKERLAREEAERKAREEAERKAREEAQQKEEQEEIVIDVSTENRFPFKESQEVSKSIGEDFLFGEPEFGMPEPTNKYKITVQTDHITDKQYSELMRTLTACGLVVLDSEVIS